VTDQWFKLCLSLVYYSTVKRRLMHDKMESKKHNTVRPVLKFKLKNAEAVLIT